MKQSLIELNDELNIELNKMVLIGVWLFSTNTMGIDTTDFTLVVVNSRNRLQMLSPEGGKIWLTTTLGKRSKSNSYLIA